MKKLKIVLISLVSLVLLLIAIAVSVTVLFDPNEYKPQLQVAASEALGMQVNVTGKLGLRFYPGLRLAMKGVEIRNKNKELVVVEEIRVGLELMPLLQKQYQIKSLSLIRPTVSIEPGAVVSKGHVAAGELPEIELSKISISDGVFSYTDKRSGDKVSANNCDITLRDLRLAVASGDLVKKLSFTSGLKCSRVRVKNYVASNVKLSLNAKGGVFDIKPVTLTVFGGKGSGEVRADYSGTMPRYQVRFALPHFSLDELLKTVSSGVTLSGPTSFSMDLSLQGKSVQQIERSASGSVVLQGKNLKLHGHDLDKVIGRFESSQSFSMLDMGALLIAGPAGVAITKGRDFASMFAGSEGNSDIRTIVSRWRVKQGVMYAKDVAMATAKHRIALLGGLDIAGGRFADVTVALIDRKGCAQVQQKINGPFAAPEVQQPSAVKAVAGPVLNLLEKGKKLLPGSDCKVIYTGEVAVPGDNAK